MVSLMTKLPHISLFGNLSFMMHLTSFHIIGIGTSLSLSSLQMFVLRSLALSLDPRILTMFLVGCRLVIVIFFFFWFGIAMDLKNPMLSYKMCVMGDPY